MSCGFIQYIRNSERAKWLRRHHPKAFLLLSLIAERARRTNELDDGLEIGEAEIGDHEEAGLTRQEYKTALRCLERNHFIVIIATQKKPRTFFNISKVGRSTTTKATTKATTKGTLVKLADNTVWDINEEKENHRATTKATTNLTTPSTTEQPPSNHKQERKKEIMEKETTASAACAAPDPAAAFFDPDKAKHLLLEFFKSQGLTAEEQNKQFKRSIPKMFLALQFISRPGFNINKTPMAALVWAFNKEPWLEEGNQPKKLTNRERVEKHFVDGEIYEGAQCAINARGVSFHRGINTGGAKFDDKTFMATLSNVLTQFNISNPFQKTINIKEA